MSQTRVRPALHGKELILAILRWILIIFFALYTSSRWFGWLSPR